MKKILLVLTLLSSMNAWGTKLDPDKVFGDMEEGVAEENAKLQEDLAKLTPEQRKNIEYMQTHNGKLPAEVEASKVAPVVVTPRVESVVKAPEVAPVSSAETFSLAPIRPASNFSLEKTFSVPPTFSPIPVPAADLLKDDKKVEKKQPTKPKSCSSDEITKFKKAYVDLQNALKYEGKNIELKNGKSKAVGNATNTENSPGEKVEKALYRQYQNALVKVGKIYQKINNDPASEDNKKILQDNPDITKFFKAIDSSETNGKRKVDINFDVLITQLKQNEVKGFELSPEDIYLLQKLVTHSQDQICTLEKYKNSKKPYKINYLEDFKNSPLNMMIKGLKGLSKNHDLQLADEDKTISEAVKDSLNQMHEVVSNNTFCLKKFSRSPDLGDKFLQTCNYGKFIRSISSGESFNQIEAILHFINGNQHAKNARNDLDWLNAQFIPDKKAPEAPKETPKEEKPAQKCTDKQVQKADGSCEDKPSLKCAEDERLNSDGTKCEKKSEDDKAKEACTAKRNESPELSPGTIDWDPEKKICVDKRDEKKSEQKEDAPGKEVNTDTVYPRTPVPGRFQPINIPTRQVFILPGMP